MTDHLKSLTNESFSTAKAYADFLSDNLLLVTYADNEWIMNSRIDHSVELLGKLAKSLGYRIEPVETEEAPTLNISQQGLTSAVSRV